jgi:hypothetical protein
MSGVAMATKSIFAAKSFGISTVSGMTIWESIFEAAGAAACGVAALGLEGLSHCTCPAFSRAVVHSPSNLGIKSEHDAMTHTSKIRRESKAKSYGKPHWERVSAYQRLYLRTNLLVQLTT